MGKMVMPIYGLRRAAVKFEQGLQFVICVGMLATVFYGVLVRYLPITGRQMAWTEEFTTLLLTWFAFWGAAAVQRKDQHFKVDQLLNLFPPSVRLGIATLSNILVIVFLLYVMFHASGLIQASWGDASIVMHFPKMLFPLALFLCNGLMVIYTVIDIVTPYRRLKNNV
jgi:TRAP-type C4-dicarboxylate transport system permease small subunit